MDFKSCKRVVFAFAPRKNEGDIMELHEKLDSIASGKRWSEDVLIEALNGPYLDHQERAVLKRYLSGSQVNMDHVRLQNIAIIIRNNRLKNNGV